MTWKIAEAISPSARCRVATRDPTKPTPLIPIPTSNNTGS